MTYFFPECELTVIRDKDGSLQFVAAKKRNGLSKEDIAHLKDASGCTNDSEHMVALPGLDTQQFFAVQKRLLEDSGP